MDKYRIDSHKLMYHPERLAAWQAGETIYPVYVEISPSGACNQRCSFCALDFMEYRPRFLDPGLLGRRLHEMAALGVRSVMFAGEGEPFLHPRLAELVEVTMRAGIDVAITTNGVLLDSETARKVLPHVTWIKASVNAGSRATYGRLHRTREEDFDRVFANLEACVRLRNASGHDCTLGAQALLLPENEGELEELAGRCRDAGLDYLVIKPYSHHPRSRTTAYRDISYRDCGALAERLARYNTASFQVIFRAATMARRQELPKNYHRCLALPFWAYIDSSGTVWGCSTHLGDERFRYGNIAEEGFQAIWEGRARAASLAWCAEHLEPKNCRLTCRMDAVNRYLWELANPAPHVNFI